MNRDPNCISTWLPVLQTAGIPTPDTALIRISNETRQQLFVALDGEQPVGAEPFFAELRTTCETIGFPVFLRTGQCSGKHRWKHTCFLERGDDLESHVYSLIEWSEMVDMIGLPWNIWAVREMLPTEPICTLPDYDDFPLVPEMRFFVGGGTVICHHPYWPRGAIEQGFRSQELPPDFEDIVRRSQEFDELEFLALANRVAEAFKSDAAWSVDILPTKRGLYVTDMAVASDSYHDPICPKLATLATVR